MDEASPIAPQGELAKTFAIKRDNSCNMKSSRLSDKRLKWSASPTSIISRKKDHVDDIYKQEDPIESSLNLRTKKGGAITTVI